MTIHAIIFDLGGVLVRTEDRTPRTRLAERYGMTYPELDELVFNHETADLAATGQIPVAQHWENVVRLLNLPIEESAKIQEVFWGGDRLDTALVAYIRSLRPRYKTGLLSNAWDDLRQELETKYQILDAFDVVIISAEVGLVKPDPRIYRLAAERLGVAPAESVFIDDFPVNVEAARAAGLHAIRFQNTPQAIADLEALLAENA